MPFLAGQSSIEDLLETAGDMDIKMFPCGMTLEVFGNKPDEFIEGIQPLCAAALVEYASDADLSLCI